MIFTMKITKHSSTHYKVTCTFFRECLVNRDDTTLKYKGIHMESVSSFEIIYAEDRIDSIFFPGDSDFHNSPHIFVRKEYFKDFYEAIMAYKKQMKKLLKEA